MPIIEYGPPGHRGVDTVMGLGADLDVVANVPDYPKAFKHVMFGGAIAAGAGLLLGHRGLTAGGAGAVVAIAVLRYLTSKSQAYQRAELLAPAPAPTVAGQGEGQVDVNFDLNLGFY